MTPYEEFAWHRALEPTLLALSAHAQTVETARNAWLDGRNIVDVERISDNPQVAEVIPGIAKSQTDLWFGLESLLTAWSRASLILYPTAGRDNRGVILRERLDVDENHPLSERGLRNSWMHFDERLESALSQYDNLTPYQFVRCVGDSDSLTLCEVAVEPLSITFLDHPTTEVLPLLTCGDDLLRRSLARVKAIDFSTP